MAYITSVGDNHLDSGSGISGLFTANTPHTQMAWLCVSEFNTAIYCIGGSYNSSASTGIQFGSYNAGDLRIWRWGGSILCSITSGLPPSNTYFHCTYTWDGTFSRIYLDGVLAEQTTEAPQTGLLNQVYLNSYPGGGASETGPNNCIADYRIYNRVLGENEIRTIHKLLGRDNIYFGLVGAWRLDEGVPGTLISQTYDYSINRNHLSPIGTNFYSQDSLTLPPLIG